MSQSIAVRKTSLKQHIANTKSKVRYLFNYRINPKRLFISALKNRTPGWNLCKTGTPDYKKTIFALTLPHGPMFIGDEMGINDPIIPIDNHEDAFHGFSFGISVDELPSDIHELANIWKKTISTYEFVKGKPYEVVCPKCKGKSDYFGSGRTEDGHLCPECFGLGKIYTFGRQKEIGQRLLAGSEIVWVRMPELHFKPDGLLALMEVYDLYHTGQLWNIMRYISDSSEVVAQIITETFPEVEILVTYDHIDEPGLCDFGFDKNGKSWNRHFYILKEGQYLNLYTGKVETPSQKPRPAKLPDELPSRDRWNVRIDILRNLCLQAK